MIVDMHSHVVPAELLARAEMSPGLFGVRREGEWLVHPEGFRAPITTDFFDAEAVLRRMDGHGIDITVLSLSPTLFFYGVDAPAAVGFARAANDALAAMVQTTPRLAGLAHLPLQTPVDAADELCRAVDELGLVGAQIGTNVGAVAMDDPRLRPVLAAAETLDVPLVLHPYFVGPKPRLEPFFLTNTIGNPLDTCIAAARLVLSGTLDRFAALRLALVHGGGFLPYQIGRLDRAHTVRPEARAHIGRPPSDYLARFWFDTLTHSDLALHHLSQLVGSLVLGTDTPYDMGDHAPLERLRRVGLDPHELGANACALLALGDRVPACGAHP